MFARSFSCLPLSFFFFFNATATTEIYTLSLHDLFRSDAHWKPIGVRARSASAAAAHAARAARCRARDRKSTRLNSSHTVISYAVFCLKKKNKSNQVQHTTRKNREQKSAQLTSHSITHR